MSRKNALLAMLVLSVATPTVVAQAPGNVTSSPSAGATSRDRAETACRAMDKVLAIPAIQAMGGRQRAETLMAAAVAYADCERSADAFAAAREADGIERNEYSAWVLAHLAAEVGAFDVSREAFVDCVRRWPEQVAAVDVQLAWRNVRALEGSPKAQRKFLQQLFDAGFDPVDGHASNLWYTLAVLHLDAGDKSGARAAAGRVMGFRNAAKMRVDRRFDGILADAPALGDPRAQGARLVEALAAKEAAYPRAMSLRVDMAEELVLLGDYPKAIAYIDASIKAVEESDGEGWTALDRQWWLMTARASANLRRGDATQAVLDLEKGASLVPPGEPPVPRFVLAEYYCDARRFDEGEAVLEGIDADAPGVAPTVAALRACLASGRGDMAKARQLAEDVAASRSPRAQSLHVLTLLMIGDVDASAEAIWLALQDPAARVDALMVLQQDRYLASLPGAANERALIEAIAARPDVRALVDAHGRVLTWDVYLGVD